MKQEKILIKKEIFLLISNINKGDAPALLEITRDLHALDKKEQGEKI